MGWLFKWLGSWDPFKKIPNFGEVVKGELYRGGKPRDGGYKSLKKKGIKTVINLIGEGEDQSKERAEAEAAGLKWIHIPLSDSVTPSAQDIADFLNYATAKDLWPVFTHCKGGRHRTGLVCAAYRISVDGWEVERAVEEMDKYGWYSENGHGPLLDWLRSNYGKRVALKGEA